MVRKTACAGISWLTGLFFASFLSFKSIFIIVFATVLIFAFYLISFKSRRKEISVCFLSFCVALSVYALYSSIVYEPIVHYDGAEITVFGKITQVDYYGDDKAVYTVSGEIEGAEKVKIHFYYDAQSCRYGDKVIVTGTAVKLEDSLSFPSESYYKPKGVFIELTKIKGLEIEEQKGFSLTRAVLSYREHIIRRIGEVLPLDEGDFLTALLCGDTSGLDASVRASLYRSGIGHITAVSGAHLSIITGILFLVLKKLKTGKCLRFAVVEAMIAVFTIFAGMKLSIIRAAVMLTIIMLGTIVKRKHDILTSLALAGFFLTIASPYAIRDTSFLLSFSGVFGIGVFAPFVLKRLNITDRFLKIPKALISMFCVSLCTFAFVAMSFNEVSVISPVSNIFLIPLCSVALIIGLIVAVFGGLSVVAYPLLTVAGVFLKVVIVLSEVFSKLPFAYLPLGYNFIIFTVFLCISGIIVVSLITRSKSASVISVFTSIVIMVISIAVFQISDDGKLKLYLLFQGSDSVLIASSSSSAVVIDLSGSGGLSQVSDKLLASKGIKNVSLLVLNKNLQSDYSTYIKNLGQPVLNVALAGKASGEISDLEAVYLNEGDKAEVSGITVTYISDCCYAIDFGEFSFLVSSYEKHITDSYNKYIIYNKDNYIMLLSEKSVMLDRNMNGDVFLITAQKSGDSVLRRLEYALSE